MLQNRTVFAAERNILRQRSGPRALRGGGGCEVGGSAVCLDLVNKRLDGSTAPGQLQEQVTNLLRDQANSASTPPRGGTWVLNLPNADFTVDCSNVTRDIK